MALSKANLQLQLLLIGKICLMPILAGLVFYYFLSKVLNTNTSLVQLYKEYYNLDFLMKITLSYIIIFVILLSIKSFWLRIIMTAIMAASWVAQLIDTGNIIHIVTGKSITVAIIKVLLPPMIWALVCLYSIDIIIFMMRFLRSIIHQHHTPR